MALIKLVIGVALLVVFVAGLMWAMVMVGPGLR
jgi:hypothetical protein